VVPKAARLGCLCLCADPASQRRIDLHSEMERDFLWGPHHILDDTGKMVHAGYRLSAGLMVAGEYMTRPVCLDDEHVLVGTPSGILLHVDTSSGRSEQAHDFHSPIHGIEWGSEVKMLLVGCEDGTLSLLSV
jgi:hypothetical protein